jgi:Leucine-rich repeat (LRR) protein
MKLEILPCSENQISDLNPLANLETLKTLTVHDNLSLSLTPLLDIPGLFVHRKPGTVFLPGSTNALDTPYIFLH